MLTSKEAKRKAAVIAVRCRVIADIAVAVGSEAVKLPEGHPNKKQVRMCLETLKKIVDKATEEAMLYLAFADEVPEQVLRDRLK